jgi:Ankyrin repeats (3 copies)
MKKPNARIPKTSVRNVTKVTKLDYEDIYRLCQNKKFDKLSEKLLNRCMTLKTNNSTCTSSGSDELKMSSYHSNQSDTTCTITTHDQVQPVHHFMPNTVRSSTLLHHILLYKPPLEVVDLVCHLLNYELKRIVDQQKYNHSNEYCVGIEEVCDKSGCTPLHIAIQHCCDHSVVTRLMQQQRTVQVKLCMSLDNKGRTPLHWAVAGSTSLVATRETTCNRPGRFLCRLSCLSYSVHHRIDLDNMYHIIQLLLEKCPDATMILDNDGNTPIDIARMYNVEARVIIALLESEMKINQVKLRPVEVVSQIETNKSGLNNNDDTINPSHRKFLGEQFDNLQQQFQCSISKQKQQIVGIDTVKCTTPTFLENFLDVIVECAEQDDDEISLLSVDDVGIIQPKLFVSEFLVL